MAVGSCAAHPPRPRRGGLRPIHGGARSALRPRPATGPESTSAHAKRTAASQNHTAATGIPDNPTPHRILPEGRRSPQNASQRHRQAREAVEGPCALRERSAGKGHGAVERRRIAHLGVGAVRSGQGWPRSGRRSRPSGWSARDSPVGRRQRPGRPPTVRCRRRLRSPCRRLFSFDACRLPWVDAAASR